MNWKLVQQVTLCIAAFLLLGSATIGFRWVTSPYLWGYVSAGLGFLALSQLASTFR